MAQESKAVSSNPTKDRTPIIVAIIGAFAIVMGAIITGLFALNSAQIAARANAVPNPIVESEQNNLDSANPNSKDSRPITPNWPLLVSIVGGLFFVGLFFWATPLGTRFRHKYLGYDPAKNYYQEARSKAIIGDDGTAMSYLGYALEWDPTILERADEDVAFEDTRKTLPYRALHQDVYKLAKSRGRVRHAPSNDLGKQIRIGGEFQEHSLEVVASEWIRYNNKGWICSGWLYLAPDVSHSVAFFKIHLWDEGNGYIHILDAANPQHTLWLETGTGFRKEEPFCWEDPNAQRTTLWQLQWG